MPMKRFVFASALALVVSLTARGADTPHWTQPYNIVWTEPGTNGLSSMPAGGGNIGLNVWAQNDGVLFYISSPDSFDANQSLTKLARIRVTVSPNPFADSLRQELELESNTVRVSGRTADGTAVSLRIRADAHQPVVHVEGTAAKPVSVTATLELDDNWKMTARPFDNGVIWSRRLPAPSAYRARMISAWGLGAIADKVPDTLGNLTCGGLLVGEGFALGASGSGTNEGRRCGTAPLKTVAPVTTFALRGALRVAQDATADAWTNEVRQLAALTATTQAADRETSAAWWHAFWDRSRIVINPESTHTNDPAWEVGRNYQLFRAMLGVNSSGRCMTMFTCGLFSCDADPDFRPWNNQNLTAQNERLLHWPLLKSGDADLLKVGTDFYARTAEFQNARIKLKFGVDGVIYDESMTTMGFGTYADKEGFSGAPVLRYHFTSGLEFVLMMIESHRYFGTDLKPYLPAIEGVARFFDTFYRKENKKRTGSELNEKGQLVIFPVNTCESSPDKINGADSLSGLIAISDAVLALPEGTIPAEMRAYFQGFRKILPPLATYKVGRLTVISSQQPPTGGLIGNGEAPQLYPVFPFGLYGVGKPDLDVARGTWSIAPDAGKAAFCWWQGNIWTARLGLTEEARRYALVKFRFPTGYDLPANSWWKKGTPTRARYPAFFDALDGPADMDHGGSAMVGLQEMLLQTDGKRLLLLPAWPPDWDVDFKLHAPEQTTVEGLVRGGKLVNLLVTPALRRADVEVLSPYRDPMTLAIDPTTVEMRLPVQFDATRVTNSLSGNIAYAWDFGDGATAREAVATHTYEKAGTYAVYLRMKGAEGRTNIANAIVTVRPVDTVPPTVVSVNVAGRSGRVAVRFSEPVRQEDAETAANYTLEPGIHVVAASLGADGATVTLTTSPLPVGGGDFSVAVKNIRDRARQPNAIAPDTRKPFRYAPLYARWKLDEGKGLVAADASGNKRDGTLKVGNTGKKPDDAAPKVGPIWTNAAGRIALSFDGVDDIVECPTTLDDLAVPFSVSFWVNPAANRLDAEIFGNHSPDGVHMVLERGGFVFAPCYVGKGFINPPPMSLTADQWQHVTVVCDGEKIFCYLNGEEKSAVAAKGDYQANPDLTFRLGQGYKEGRFFRGLLSDFRIYRTALSPAEVQAVMKQ